MEFADIIKSTAKIDNKMMLDASYKKTDQKDG